MRIYEIMPKSKLPIAEEIAESTKSIGEKMIENVPSEGQYEEGMSFVDAMGKNGVPSLVKAEMVIELLKVKPMSKKRIVELLCFAGSSIGAVLNGMIGNNTIVEDGEFLSLV